MTKSTRNSLIEEAAARRPSVVSEFVHFMSENKKWWLTPIVVCLLALGLLVVIGGSAAAPFIYTLF
jgi:hypothetical protein